MWLRERRWDPYCHRRSLRFSTFSSFQFFTFSLFSHFTFYNHQEKFILSHFELSMLCFCFLRKAASASSFIVQRGWNVLMKLILHEFSTANMRTRWINPSQQQKWVNVNEFIDDFHSFQPFHSSTNVTCYHSDKLFETHLNVNVSE